MAPNKGMLVDLFSAAFQTCRNRALTGRFRPRAAKRRLPQRVGSSEWLGRTGSALFERLRFLEDKLQALKHLILKINVLDILVFDCAGVVKRPHGDDEGAMGDVIAFFPKLVQARLKSGVGVELREHIQKALQRERLDVCFTVAKRHLVAY